MIGGCKTADDSEVEQFVPETEFERRGEQGTEQEQENEYGRAPQGKDRWAILKQISLVIFFVGLFLVTDGFVHRVACVGGRAALLPAGGIVAGADDVGRGAILPGCVLGECDGGDGELSPAAIVVVADCRERFLLYAGYMGGSDSAARAMGIDSAAWVFVGRGAIRGGIPDGGDIQRDNRNTDIAGRRAGEKKADALQIAADWWASDAIAIVTVTPFLLAYVTPRLKTWMNPGAEDQRHAERWQKISVRTILERGGQAASVVAGIWLLFGFAPAIPYQPFVPAVHTSDLDGGAIWAAWCGG